jgi:hypothetical protein
VKGQGLGVNNISKMQLSIMDRFCSMQCQGDECFISILFWVNWSKNTERCLVIPGMSYKTKHTTKEKLKGDLMEEMEGDELTPLDGNISTSGTDRDGVQSSTVHLIPCVRSFLANKKNQ